MLEDDTTESDASRFANAEGEYTLEVRSMAKNMEAWREILVHLDRIFNWEQPRVLAGMQVGVTLIFLLIWMLGPSLITSIAFVGLICIAIDFSVPIVAPRMFERSSWSQYEEDHFLGICDKLYYVRNSISETVSWLSELRVTRPTFYFTLMAVFFTILAFIGDKCNNMVLCYLTITVGMMMPGLIKHGIITRLYSQLRKTINKKMGKKE